MMNKPRVLVTRRIDPEAEAILAQAASVEIWQEAEPPSKEVLLQKLAGVDGLLTMLTDPIDEQVINANAANLKVIAQMAVGYDNIDIAAATRHGIPVGHTPGVLTETTADFAWALMMAAARRVVEADGEVRSGNWLPWGPDVLTGVDIYGKTIGIIGLGRIGKAMARRAKGFSMRVLYFDNNRDPKTETELGIEFSPLDDLIRQSDFVTLHVYYSPESHHLINRDRFEQMKPSAVLVNTSRGAIVDPDALTQALQTSQIAAAGIDVFDPEPIPADHPILKLKNLVIAPHIASASKETRKRMALMTVENITAGLNDKHLPYCANPEVYKPDQI